MQAANTSDFEVLITCKICFGGLALLQSRGNTRRHVSTLGSSPDCSGAASESLRQEGLELIEISKAIYDICRQNEILYTVKSFASGLVVFVRKRQNPHLMTPS